MPRSPPQSEHNPKTSPESYEARSSGGLNYLSRDPAKRLDPPGQSSAPTLPSVAALTGYGTPGPQPVTGVDAGSPVSYRSLGVHTILNPSTDVDLAKITPRISQSPGRSVSTHGPYQTPIVSPRVRKRKEDASPGRTSQSSMDARQGRRLLTPKSPSLRSISQGLRASPSAGSRTSNPHNESRVYTADQGNISAGQIPPLPPIAPGMGSHGQYAMTQPHHEHYPSTGPGSVSNSTTSYSANNPGYIDSPSSSSNLADRENTSPFRPTFSDSVPRSGSHQQSTGSDSQSRGPNRAYGAGQPAYQMQISTDQGPVAIPVEIDLQQASKSADEKRKRNAGASARFRQRRKEKEQAASAHINDLRAQLQTLTEQRDFYRSERNFFRDVLAHTPGAQLPPRPPSPQMRTGSGQAVAAVADSHAGGEYVRREITEPSPAQRRRTSDYQPSFATGSYPPYPPSAPPGPGYALPPPSLPTPMQDPRGPMPNSYISPHGAQPGPPPPPPSGGLRPQSHDPFRRDMNAR